MKKMRQTYSRFIRMFAIVPCMLVLFTIANQVVFLHTHISPSGQVVVHAHPYDKQRDTGPLKQHHHSLLGYLYFQQLQNPVPLVHQFCLQVADLKLIGCVSHFEIRPVQDEAFRWIVGRSPPLT